MRRIITTLPLALLLVSLPFVSGCEKKDKETATPEDGTDAEADVDPVEALKATPDRIKAEIDMVLQPIDEAEALMAELETMPERYNISAADFKGLVQASFDSETGTVEISADLGIAADAQADLLAQLTALRELKMKLAATPETVKVAAENIATIGVETIGLATKTAASLQAKAKVAIGNKKAEVEAQLQEVLGLKDQLMTELEAAKSEVTELPARAAEVGAKFSASFAASATAG